MPSESGSSQPQPRRQPPPLRLLAVMAGLLCLSLAGCPSPEEEEADTPTPNSPTDTSPPSPTPGDPSFEQPSPWPELGDYLVLVPDNGSNQFKIFDPRGPSQVYTLDLRTHHPSLCGATSGCFIFGGQYALEEGLEVLDLTYGKPGQTGLGAGFRGALDRVVLGSPDTLRWRLQALDFSSLPGGATHYCAASSEDPCEPDPEASIAAQSLCSVGDAHDFAVLSDDTAAQQAELLVTDTDTYRMYTVRLDYAGGNTCGKVTSYVDSKTDADWLPQSQPNSLEPARLVDRQIFIITFRGVSRDSGDGFIQAWEWLPGGQWQRLWMWPEPVEGEARHLHVPHGGQLTWDAASSQYLFRFADSASLSNQLAYNPSVTPPGGSVGVLGLSSPDLAPDYLHDLMQPLGEDPWAFPRSAVVAPDGTLVVADSGCQVAAGCPYFPMLRWILDETRMNSERLGFWTPDHRQLELLDQSPSAVFRLHCGLLSPFLAQVLPAAQLGPVLTSARASGGQVCTSALR